MHRNKISEKFSLSGVYKLACPDCKKSYVGQTGGSFTIRYNEHKHAFLKNSHTSKFAQHLNEHAHSFGTINNFVQILRYHKKGAYLNTIERFYIDGEHDSNNQLNDSYTIFPYAIFANLRKTHRPYTPSPFTHHIPHAVNIPILQHKPLHPHKNQGRPKELTHTHCRLHVRN